MSRNKNLFYVYIVQSSILDRVREGNGVKCIVLLSNPEQYALLANGTLVFINLHLIKQKYALIIKFLKTTHKA